MTGIFYHQCHQCQGSVPYLEMTSILVEAKAPEYGVTPRLICPKCHNRAQAAEWRRTAISVLLAPVICAVLLAVLSVEDADPFQVLPAVMPTVILLTLAASAGSLLASLVCERKSKRVQH